MKKGHTGSLPPRVTVTISIIYSHRSVIYCRSTIIANQPFFSEMEQRISIAVNTDGSATDNLLTIIGDRGYNKCEQNWRG
jgi:hypothetical protein